MKISKIVSVALLSAGFYSAANADANFDRLQNFYEDTITLDHIIQKYVGKITADSNSGPVSDVNLINLAKDILKSDVDFREGVNFGQYTIGLKEDKTITIINNPDRRIADVGAADDSLSLKFNESGQLIKTKKSNFNTNLSDIFTKEQLTKNVSEKISQTLAYVGRFKSAGSNVASDDVKDFLDIVEKAKDPKRAQATQLKILNDFNTDLVKTTIGLPADFDITKSDSIKQVDAFLDKAVAYKNDSNSVANQLLTLAKDSVNGLLQAQAAQTRQNRILVKKTATLLLKAIDDGYKLFGITTAFGPNARTNLSMNRDLTKNTQIGTSANHKSLLDLSQINVESALTDIDKIVKELGVIVGLKVSAMNQMLSAPTSFEDSGSRSALKVFHDILDTKFIDEYAFAKYVEKVVLGAKDQDNVIGKGVLLSSVSSGILNTKTALDAEIEKATGFKNLSSQNSADINNLIKVVNNVDLDIKGTPTNAATLKTYIDSVNKWIDQVNSANIFEKPFDKLTDTSSGIEQSKVAEAVKPIAEKIKTIKDEITKLNEYAKKLTEYDTAKETYSRLLNARLAYVVNQTSVKDSSLKADSSLLANLASASADNSVIRDLLSADIAVEAKEADVRTLLENLDKSVKEVKDISSQFTSLDNARIISNLATGTRLAQLSNPYSNDLALASAIKNLEKAKFAEAGNNENGASALSSVIREYSSRFDSKNNVWGSVLSGKLVSKKGINPTSFGVSVGYDKVYDSSIFGIYANYTNTFANQEFLKASTNGLSIGLYSRAYTDQNEFDAKLSFSHNTNRYTRSQSKKVELPTNTTGAVAPASADPRVNPNIDVASSAAEFNGFGLSADLAYGHVADLGDSSYIKPLVGLNFQYNKSNSFKEKLADATKGNAVLLQFSDSTSRILTARVGAEFRKYVNEKAYVYATPALEYDIVNNLNQAQVKIQGAADNIKFDKTKSKKSLYGSLSIGGDFSISEKLSANINGALKVGSAKQYYNGSLGLRYKF